MKLQKKIISAVIALSMTLTSVGTMYASTIDELVETQHVASGIEYSKIKQLTTNGFNDIYLLTMDLNDPNVDFDILRNSDDFGVQQTLQNLVGDTTETNVVGAVNGSFFFTDTNPTDPIGYEYEDGQWTFVKEGYNKQKLEENAVIISNDNDVEFDYIQANTILYNSRGQSERIVTVNGNRDLINMTLVSPVMMKDSTEIESLGNVYKWVIEDGVVTDIVEPKTIATVPENGYLLTVNYNSAPNMREKFPIGEHVTVGVTTNIDDILDETKLIISGAGSLVVDGQVNISGLSASGNSRQPRTCIGVSQDGNILYVMAVDGRGESIGMTNKQAAEYMISLGAYNAINFDGGGSTTFAVREEGDTQTEVVNKPSDGSQRRVINGFGVTTSPTGPLAKLKVIVSSEKTLVGQPVSFTVSGLDENDNPVSIDTSLIQVKSSDAPENIISGNSLTFTTPGIKIVDVIYGDIVEQVTIDVYGSDNVNYEIEPISVGLGETKDVEVKATTDDGTVLPINESLLTFTTNGNFTVASGKLTGGSSKGVGQISTTIDGKAVTGNVSVGASDIYIPVTSFEGMTVGSKPYPNGNEGATGVYQEHALSGTSAIKTNFNFKASGKPQAVYSLLSGVKIDDSRAEKLCVNYYGDSAGNSVKAIISDAEGTEKVLVFTDSVDYNGYSRLEADIPDGLVYPISVDRLYVASTGSRAISGTGYFDYLTYTIGDSYEASQNTIDLSYDELLNKGNTQALFTVNHKADNSASNYYTKVYPDTKLIYVPSITGSISLLNSSNYGKLKNELYNSSQKNIVIVSNQSVDKNTFSISEEGQMLQNMLDKYASAYEKNIYYINDHSNVNDTDYINGIRYIDLYDKNVVFGLSQNGDLLYHSIN